jgi:hypothetical protein
VYLPLFSGLLYVQLVNAFRKDNGLLDADLTAKLQMQRSAALMHTNARAGR